MMLIQSKVILTFENPRTTGQSFVVDNAMFTSASLRSLQKQIRLATGRQSQQLNIIESTPSESRSISTNVIENLTTILHLSLLRRDVKRAERAFAMLLRCERHGVSLRTLWELGLEILLRSGGIKNPKIDEFLGRVRLAASDVGRHPATAKQVRVSLRFPLIIR